MLYKKFYYFFLASMILFFIATDIKNVSAQSKGFRYGGYSGIGKATMPGFDQDQLDQSGKLALSGGVSGGYQFNEYFGINTDIVLTSKGTKGEGVEKESNSSSGFFSNGSSSNKYKYTDTYSFLYTEIQLLPKVGYGLNNFYINLLGGPSLNFNITGSFKRDYDDENKEDLRGNIGDRNIMTYGIVYGAAFSIETKDQSIYSLTFKVNNSLISYSSSRDDKVTNRYLAVGIKYLH